MPHAQAPGSRQRLKKASCFLVNIMRQSFLWRLHSRRITEQMSGLISPEPRD